MQTKNLSTKKLTDFTPEDTIYMRDVKDARGTVHLCQFISYNPRNATVTGKVIKTLDEREQKQHEGKILTASYRNCCLYGNATDEENRAYYRWFDSSLYAMHPLEEHKVFDNNVHVQKHPSYGLARFSRVNRAAGTPLFGSSIQNKQTITLVIERAEHDRKLNNDWYHGKGQLIEIEMSQTQFAELITSFNMGSGIPVTITQIKLTTNMANENFIPNAKHKAAFKKVVAAFRAAKKAGLIFYGKSGDIVAYTKEADNYIEQDFEASLRGEGRQIECLSQSGCIQDSGADDYGCYLTKEDEPNDED